LVGLLVPIKLPVLVEARETLPKIDIALRLEEEELGVLTEWKSVPEFFRVFTMSTKLTNFAVDKEGVVECWL
jgi:hypothetical protein